MRIDEEIHGFADHACSDNFVSISQFVVLYTTTLHQERTLAQY